MATTFTGLIKTPVMFGADATTQNLFSIENGIASRKNIVVRRLLLQNDPLVALTAVCPVVKTSRGVNISGGILLEKGPFDALQTSDPYVNFRCQNAESAKITATAASAAWQQFSTRMHTQVEQVQNVDINLLPRLCQDTAKKFILRPGENLLVQMVAAAASSNALTTNNYTIICAYEEEEVSVYNISGTVTLGGSGVTGAIVTVIQADDESMTNPVLVEKIVTPAGGAWSSTIITGKVGSAFVQYKNGATYYTAPGSPFLS